ncbi:hypothetical protein [Agaribacterium sp. ZY112]|uniref:hypothetical protein n=1 Tax=Agaribacterium sp. ZY112 TaxID=3233574 RepID=UPI00352588F1
MILKKVTLLAAVLLLANCGGGSSSSNDDSASAGSGGGASPDPVATQTGVFLDSAIANIGYKTETLEGVTNTLGEYDYLDGETVTFFIGDLELPAVAAKDLVTPLDLAGSDDTTDATVVNIIRLLQTLDEDGIAENGITITENAKSAATQVDFSVSVSEFESLAAVSNLIANSGSTNTELVSEGTALAHFETTLAAEGEDFIASTNITGAWSTNLTDNDLLVLLFFADGSYVHIEVDEEEPIDAFNEISGMEWGTYVKNNDSNELTIGHTFDENGETGFTDATLNLTRIFAQVDGDELTMQFDDNLNGEIEEDESLVFSRLSSEGILGAWTSDLTDNDFLGLIFFDNGTYVHLEVDEVAPIDEEGEESGMEWGTYTRNSNTGELTVTQVFDANGDIGFNDAANGETVLFANALEDVLTLGFDGDGSLAFKRL